MKDLDFGAVDAEADQRLAEYFVNTPQVAEAIRFRSAHFIGRKGSGKSAIFTQLPRLSRDKYGDKISVSLMTPDQYAWGALREYEERGLLSEQAHTNAWKFTIAVEAASAVLELDDSVLDTSSREAVEKIRSFIVSNYGDNTPTPAKTVRRLVKGLSSFNLEAFGFGLGFEKEKQDYVLAPQIIDLLLESVKQVCSGLGVIVAADKLDDSWDGSDVSKSLMVGLLKASKEINDEYLDEAGNGINIITFIRSDIYQLLEFDDKGKHRAI